MTLDAPVAQRNAEQSTMGRQVAYLSNDLFFRIRHGKQIQALHHTMKKTGLCRLCEACHFFMTSLGM